MLFLCCKFQKEGLLLILFYHTFFCTVVFLLLFKYINCSTNEKEQTFQIPTPSKTLEVADPTFTHWMAAADRGFLVTHQAVHQLDRILQLQHISSKCASKPCLYVLAPCEERHCNKGLVSQPHLSVRQEMFEFGN